MDRQTHIIPIILATSIVGVICITGAKATDLIPATDAVNDDKKTQENDSLCTPHSTNTQYFQINLLNNSFIWVHCKKTS